MNKCMAASFLILIVVSAWASFSQTTIKAQPSPSMIAAEYIICIGPNGESITMTYNEWLILDHDQADVHKVCRPIGTKAR